MKKLLTFALTFIPTVAYCNLNNVDYSKGATFSDVLEAFSILLLICSPFIIAFIILAIPFVIVELIVHNSKSKKVKEAYNLFHIILGILTLGLWFVFRGKD